MRSDGEFTIKSGGITQNIQIELNLSDNDCKALGSIWQDILDELEDTSNYTVSNNNNKLINKENDYKVFQGAVIKFSEDCWKRIVSKVSMTLGRAFDTIYDKPQKKEEQLPTMLPSEELENWYYDTKKTVAFGEDVYEVNNDNLSKEILDWEAEYKKSNPEMSFIDAVEYLNNNPNLSVNIREHIKNTFGICDGNIDNNKQGRKGTCHLISCYFEIKKCEKLKELSNSIVVQNNDGTVTVTFWGDKDENGNPWKIILNNKDVKESYRSYDNYGSTDPDLAALELAYEEYVKQKAEESANTKKELENIKNQCEDLNREKIRVRILDLHDYLKTNRPKDKELKEIKKYLKENYNFIKSENYDDIINKFREDGMLDKIVDNVLKERSSQYNQLEEERKKLGNKYQEIENRYYDTYGSLNLNYDENNLGESLGSSPDATFRILTGLTSENVSAKEFLPENAEDLPNFDEVFDNAFKQSREKFINNSNVNNIPTVVNFKENKDIGLYWNHAYSLKEVYFDENRQEKVVVVYNPWGHEVTLTYNEFIEHVGQICYIDLESYS